MNRRLLATLLAIVSLTILLVILLFILHDDYVKIATNKDKAMKEAESYRKKNRKIRKVFSVFGDVVVLGVFGLLLYARIHAMVNHELFTLADGSSYVTVISGSMSYAYEKNEYLAANGLKNQIPLYSLIELDKLEEEDEIQLYDVCVYQDENNDWIVHRVIGIVEKDSGTYYRFKGDANANSDFYLVERDKIVYRWDNVQYVGLGRVISFARSGIGVTVALYVFILMAYSDSLNRKKEKIFDKLPKPKHKIVFEPRKPKPKPIEYPPYPEGVAILGHITYKGGDDE